MDKENIIKCLEKHLKWLKDEEGGEKADLYSADLRGADLYSADLYSANLSGADLRGADLYSADLSGADLSGANMKIFHGGEWIAFIDPEFIRIGCKCFTSSEWDGFSDEIIDNMANGALEYWKENKEINMLISKKLQEKFIVKETE